MLFSYFIELPLEGYWDTGLKAWSYNDYSSASGVGVTVFGTFVAGSSLFDTLSSMG